MPDDPVAMAMSCTQSNPWIRKQLNLLLASAKVSSGQRQIQKVLLPFAQDPDQASTAAPDDDDELDLFGREEAVRMDEEIMDFQWFDNIPWGSIKDLRGTTYVQPPTRFKFALRQAQHAIQRAIIHDNPSSLASESAWKALVLRSWLLLGRPAVNASESNCAHFLEARLELFWAEDWSALRAMVRAECDIAPVQNATRRTATQQKQSRVRKVGTLARTGVKGRAWQLPETHHQSQSQSRLFKRSRVSTRLTQNPPAPAQAFVSRLTCQKWLSTSTPLFAKCHDSVNLDNSACARNICMSLALWRGTATYLCK